MHLSCLNYVVLLAYNKRIIRIIGNSNNQSLEKRFSAHRPILLRYKSAKL